MGEGDGGWGRQSECECVCVFVCAIMRWGWARYYHSGWMGRRRGFSRSARMSHLHSHARLPHITPSPSPPIPIAHTRHAVTHTHTHTHTHTTQHNLPSATPFPSPPLPSTHIIRLSSLSFCTPVLPPATTTSKQKQETFAALRTASPRTRVEQCYNHGALA